MHATRQMSTPARTLHALAWFGITLALGSAGCSHTASDATSTSIEGQEVVERAYDLAPGSVYEARVDLHSEIPFEVRIDPDNTADVDLQVYHVFDNHSQPTSRLFRFSEDAANPYEHITAVFPAGAYTLVVENRDKTRRASGRVIAQPIQLAWQTEPNGVAPTTQRIPFELSHDRNPQQHWLWVRERTRLSVRVTPGSPISTAKAQAPSQETANTRDPASVDATYNIGLLATHVTGGENPTPAGDHATPWTVVASSMQVASGESLHLTSHRWIDPGLYFLGSTAMQLPSSVVIQGAYEVEAENFGSLSISNLQPNGAPIVGSFRDHIDVGLGVGVHIYRIPAGTKGPIAVHLGNIPEGSDYELIVVDAQNRIWGESTAYDHTPERVVLQSPASTVDLFALVILNDQNSQLRAQPYHIWVDGNVGDQNL
jgi:hypothetical protein